MNWFAVAVVVLQIAAAIQYAISSKWSDAAIWFFYACINVVLIARVSE